jgi:hypothetical protein
MKHRSTRERQEAAMRLRNSAQRLRRLQLRLAITGHGPDDPYRKAKIQEFWEKIRLDKRMAKGEV